MRKRIAVVLAIATLLACEDETTRPPPAVYGKTDPGTNAGGGQPGSDAGTDAGSDAGACTTLTITGNRVDQLGIVGEPPPGTGGTVLDGTYDMIEAQLYLPDGGAPGVTGNSFRGSLRISGSTVERSVIFTGNAGGDSRSVVRGTLTVSGANGTYAIACPSLAQESLAVSVPDGGASLTLSNQVTKEAFVWSKRP
jgi:hypothetical protein